METQEDIQRIMEVIPGVVLWQEVLRLETQTV